MSQILKIILATILSGSKAILNVFVYFFSVVLTAGFLIELFNINIFEYVKFILIIFIPIVFINDWIKNFILLCPFKKAKSSSVIKSDSKVLEEKKNSCIEDKPFNMGNLLVQKKEKEVKEIPIVKPDEYIDWTGRK